METQHFNILNYSCFNASFVFSAFCTQALGSVRERYSFLVHSQFEGHAILLKLFPTSLDRRAG